jgi:hypothetical protein
MIYTQDLPERIASKIDGNQSCWIWTAARTGLGYGCVYWNGRQAMAHRVVYEVMVGAIPDGMELDHLCRNPPCVNPDHLEPVTHGENMRRGLIQQRSAEARLAKTHCPHGHLYDYENTYHFITSSGQSGRGCRICRRIASTQSARRRRTRKAAD